MILKSFEALFPKSACRQLSCLPSGKYSRVSVRKVADPMKCPLTVDMPVKLVASFVEGNLGVSANFQGDCTRQTLFPGRPEGVSGIDRVGNYAFRASYVNGGLPPVFTETKTFRYGFIFESADRK